MGCGCRKGTANDQRSTTDTSGQFEVWRNGTFTGRRFASVGSAQQYANRIGGEVRTA
jgi:hypothetical protein